MAYTGVTATLMTSWSVADEATVASIAAASRLVQPPSGKSETTTVLLLRVIDSMLDTLALRSFSSSPRGPPPGAGGALWWMRLEA